MPVEICTDSVSEYLAEIGGGSDLLRFGATRRHPITVVIPLGHADTGGGVASWQNPEAVSILITRCVADVTTVATGAATVDVGAQATGATTSSDNLIDGFDAHTATGLFSAADGDSTNGKLQQKLAAGKWVTASKASGACAGLAGNLYLTYILV